MNMRIKPDYIKSERFADIFNDKGGLYAGQGYVLFKKDKNFNAQHF